MGRNKYQEDYRLKETIADGKIRQTAEYIGNYYVFSVPAAGRKPLAKKLLGVCALAAAVYLIPLCTVNHLSNVPYVVIPHICSAIGLWLLLSSLVQTGFGREPMIREQADRATEYYSYGYGIGIAASAVAIAGCAIWIFFFSQGNPGVWDLVFAVCDGVILGTCILCHRHRTITETCVTNDPV